MADSRIDYSKKILTIPTILLPQGQADITLHPNYLDYIEGCKKWLHDSSKERDPKAAFFDFLKTRITANLRHDRSTLAVEQEQHKQQIRIMLRKYDANGELLPVPVPDADETQDTPSLEPHCLVTKDEELFAFLCVNVTSLISDKELALITGPVYDNKKALKDANWEIAQLLYSRLKFSKSSDDKLRLKLIVGYLFGCITDEAITKVMQDEENNLVGIRLKHLVTYRMSDRALQTLPPNKWSDQEEAPRVSQQMGPFEQTFGDELMWLINDSRKHKPITGGAAAPTKYDDDYVARSEAWITALNELYFSLENDDEKKQLAEIVREANDYHHKIRELKALHPAEKLATAQKAQELRSEAERLRNRVLGTDSKPGLFYAGKPSSGWRIALGIVLLILGLGLIAAGVAAIWFPPAAAFFMSFGVIASKTILVDMAIGACVVGGATVLGGTFSIFKGAGRRPATVLTETNKVINFCEQTGLDSCAKEAKAAEKGVEASQRITVTAS